MPPPPDADPAALDALRERIRATQEAVQRLADETARARAEGPPPGAPPPPGADGAAPGQSATEELQALVALVDLLRGMLPPELQVQVTELIRQFLVVIRALLDWWIERIDVRPAGPAPVEVQDIEVS